MPGGTSPEKALGRSDPQIVPARSIPVLVVFDLAQLAEEPAALNVAGFPPAHRQSKRYIFVDLQETAVDLLFALAFG